MVNSSVVISAGIKKKTGRKKSEEDMGYALEASIPVRRPSLGKVEVCVTSPSDWFTA
jgi:hypothetical protein